MKNVSRKFSTMTDGDGGEAAAAHHRAVEKQRKGGRRG